MGIIKQLGSLTFTAVISIFLMVLLVTSTVMESVHGTSFAQKTFYQTRWFDFVLSLIWINIFCSTMMRFPFRKHHIGFLVTHIGILGLLLGSLVTRLFSVEGQMILAEGQASNQIRLVGYQITAQLPDQKSIPLDLKEGSQPLQVGHVNYSVSVNTILEHADENLIVQKGSSESPKKLAARINLQSQAMSLNRSFWVVEDDSESFQSNAVFIGPLKISLKEKKEPVAQALPTFIVSNKAGKEVIRLDLTKPIPAEVALLGTGLTIKNFQYFPYARVAGNKLANFPESGTLNPAVDFEVMDSKGNSQHYIKFALFPDFESMHHKVSAQEFDIVTKLDVPHDDRQENYTGPSLTFFAAGDGKWSYRADSKEGGVPKDGEAKPGILTALGWADMSFRVEETVNNAVISHAFVQSSDNKGKMAVEIAVQNGPEENTYWLTEESPQDVRTLAGNIVISLGSAQQTLPFSLSLKDFRKKDYPGTETPSSFESDVTLQDDQQKIKIEKTISMNKPLDYQGFRFFQSSYIQDPNSGEASIFTVAKNPGISLIYFSSCTLFIGAMLQYYVKQFSRKPGLNGDKAFL